MSKTRVEAVVNTLSTVVLVGVVVMSKLLPSTSVLSMENSVCEPSLRVLTQVMVGRGEPSAVQLRESGEGLKSSTELTGGTVIEGATAGGKTKIYLASCSYQMKHSKQQFTIHFFHKGRVRRVVIKWGAFLNPQTIGLLMITHSLLRV